MLFSLSFKALMPDFYLIQSELDGYCWAKIYRVSRMYIFKYNLFHDLKRLSPLKTSAMH